ncbi:MAG: hypothetical protein JO026_00615, partial [Patescibacteria group bacterium]|nr:hypothetical protein [Patescibacteria group bacterium]
MAKKKKRKNAVKPIPRPSLTVKTETARSIYGILVLVLTLIFLAAPLGKGGPVGGALYGGLTSLFGVGYYLIPLSLAFLSFGLFRERREHGWGGTRFFGAGILFLSGIALFSIAGNYGGTMGALVASPFISLFDTILGTLILGAIAVTGILLALDTPIRLPSLPPRKESDTAERSLKKPEVEVLSISDPYEEPPKAPEPVKSKKEPKEKEKTPPIETREEELATSPFAPADRAYTPPPLSLLDRDKGKPETGDIKANANLIKRTLQNFGITVEMDEVAIGPSVTRYALKPAEGVRLQKILGLQNNLELALAAHPVRIEAPIPGKSLVGIEVPNMKKATVGLGSLLGDDKFQNDPRSLLIALGRDIAGASHFANIGKMPHLLIAGATGSGKSVAIHALITSLLYRNGPASLRFIMVDPKRVELTLYNSVPHLLTPVITDPKKAILSLKWAAKEMERRYNILETSSVRDIVSYHENVIAKATTKDGEAPPDQMPYIVIVIDELADIMQSYPRELEAGIVRLAQMSRAVGIHLV